MGNLCISTDNCRKCCPYYCCYFRAYFRSVDEGEMQLQMMQEMNIFRSIIEREIYK